MPDEKSFKEMPRLLEFELPPAGEIQKTTPNKSEAKIRPANNLKRGVFFLIFVVIRLIDEYT